ncbi:hypothetical protein EXS72_03035 [Candidatus Pacearchaeota archaeon]|nr:hypothetical protein [Candidatus Pacearchaeota archaeon]
MVMNLKNRKGDVTITTVILVVLGVVVLVMLISGFISGTGFFFGIFDKAPGELQSVASACGGTYVPAGLSIDFCKYRLIDDGSGDELVNCNDVRIKGEFDKSNVVVPSGWDDCPNDKLAITAACAKFSESKKKSVKINGGSSGNCISPITTGKTG